MENPDKKDGDDSVEKAVQHALASGRNANDNFQEGDTDDYGTDGSDEEKIERETIKGGNGQKGFGRNSNDNFADDEKAD